MKQTLFLFIVFTNSLVYSQMSFDYHKQFKIILAETKNESSAFNYTKQLKKFTENDTLQTDQEVLSLLVGFTANLHYKPYADLLLANAIYKLNESGKYQDAYVACSKILAQNPFHIPVMIEMSYALTGLGKTAEAKVYQYKMFKIYKAMLYSCNNRPNQYTIFALAPKDGEYFIKYFLRKEVEKISNVINKEGDFVTIIEVKNSAKTDTYQFVLEHTQKKIHKKA